MDDDGRETMTSVITNCIRLAPMLCKYTLSAGPASTVIIPNASCLSKIQEVTVRGTVLRKQTSHWDPKSLRQRISPGKSKKRYELCSDGSLEFCVGVKPLQPHIACVITDGDPLLPRINSPGAKITLSGFLRSSFEQSGLKSADNARIFELNPFVRWKSMARFGPSISTIQRVWCWSGQLP